MVLSIPPAQAQLTGACTIEFNGIEVERIDSLNSPLELDAEDTLIFSGIDPSGTRSAQVELIIGPVTVESNATTYATPEEEFLATISLDDVSPYGVGLFRAEGATDGCTAAVWIRVSGRFPFATLAGLTALGLALGGITGQLGAIASRHRWARSAAALGGIATGPGLTLVGQELGRLQVSYPSLAGMAVAAGGLGFISASLFNPTILRRRREARSVLPGPEPALVREAEVVASESTLRPASQPANHGATPETEPAPSRSTTERLPQPAPQNAPHWCYVLAPTDVFDLTDHTKTIAVLEPGNWYLAKRTLGGWVQVVAAEGSEGWVAQGAIHRQG